MRNIHKQAENNIKVKGERKHENGFKKILFHSGNTMMFWKEKKNKINLQEVQDMMQTFLFSHAAKLEQIWKISWLLCIHENV